MKKALLCIFLLLQVNAVLAVAVTPKGKITGYYTGWGTEQIRVNIEGANYSEGACPTKDSYITLPRSANAGYDTQVSALLASYMAGKAVSLIIDTTTCVDGRPKILAVYID